MNGVIDEVNIIVHQSTDFLNLGLILFKSCTTAFAMIKNNVNGPNVNHYYQNKIQINLHIVVLCNRCA